MSLDVATLRAQFPLLAADPGLHYLDSAASAQVPRVVLDAVARHETTARANVHRGVHRLAEAATAAYEGARARVARYLNVAASEIVFTGGATAAINLVAHSFTQALSPGDAVVVSELDHHSNLVPWQIAAERSGLVLRAIPATADGRLDLDALDRVLDARTKLIAVTHASNVTGAVTDVARIVVAARSVGARVLLDGAQRAPHGPLDLPALGIDFYALSGHKLFGPNGVGVLWGRGDLLAAMPPFMGGGEMIRRVTLAKTTYADPPARFEAGTPPIAQAVGMGAAVDWLLGLDWPAIAAHELALAGRLMDGLAAIRGARLVGPAGLQARLPVISMTLDGAHPHDVAQILDARGVAVRGGHHCAQPLMDRLDLAGTIRASLALYSDAGDVDSCLEGLAEAARRLT